MRAQGWEAATRTATPVPTTYHRQRHTYIHRPARVRTGGSSGIDTRQDTHEPSHRRTQQEHTTSPWGAVHPRRARYWQHSTVRRGRDDQNALPTSPREEGRQRRLLGRAHRRHRDRSRKSCLATRRHKSSRETWPPRTCRVRTSNTAIFGISLRYSLTNSPASSVVLSLTPCAPHVSQCLASRVRTPVVVRLYCSTRRTEVTL